MRKNISWFFYTKKPRASKKHEALQSLIQLFFTQDIFSISDFDDFVSTFL